MVCEQAAGCTEKRGLAEVVERVAKFAQRQGVREEEAALRCVREDVGAPQTRLGAAEAFAQAELVRRGSWNVHATPPWVFFRLLECGAGRTSRHGQN